MSLHSLCGGLPAGPDLFALTLLSIFVVVPIGLLAGVYMLSK